MRNRQGAAWKLEAAPWSGPKAVRLVAERLEQWGLRAPEGLAAVVRLLVDTVATDGGRHISLHVAEQRSRLLVLALSHRSAGPGSEVLDRLRQLGAASCGTELSQDGRQVWAVLDGP